MFVKGNKYGRGNSKSGRKTKAEEFAEVLALKNFELELARIQVAMADKELSKEEYKTLIDAIDKVNKNIQLLKGKPTENVKFTEENYDRAEEYFIQKASSKVGLPE
jgi:hypothetical protein